MFPIVFSKLKPENMFWHFPSCIKQVPIKMWKASSWLTLKWLCLKYKSCSKHFTLFLLFLFCYSKSNLIISVNYLSWNKESNQQMEILLCLIDLLICKCRGWCSCIHSIGCWLRWSKWRLRLSHTWSSLHRQRWSQENNKWWVVQLEKSCW